MAIKLHRCSTTWIKGPHPCWQVQKALDEQGIDYEIVRHPSFPRGRRKAYIQLTGQKLFPAIELEGGKVIREESKDMVSRIREGRLFDGAGQSPGMSPSGGSTGESPGVSPSGGSSGESAGQSASGGGVEGPAGGSASGEGAGGPAGGNA